MLVSLLCLAGLSLTSQDNIAPQLDADDVCVDFEFHANGSSPCAFMALQMRGKKQHLATKDGYATQRQLPLRVGMSKLPRLDSRREPPGQRTGSLTGAAWADYSVQVIVGGQAFRVIVDTGSATFAIPTTRFRDCTNYYHGTCDGEQVGARYGSGNWSGRICRNVEVTLAGLSAGEPAFAGITAQQNFLTECSSIPGGITSEGIVGLAYETLIKGFEGKPLLDAVLEKNGLQNMFGMQCCPWTGNNSGKGSITLGGWDEEHYRESDFQYTPITMETWFCVELISLSVGEKRKTMNEIAPLPSLNNDAYSCSPEPVGSCLLADCDDGSQCDMFNMLCRCPTGSCNYNGKCTPEHLVLSQVRSAANGSQANDRHRWGWSFESRRRRSSRCGSIIDSGTSALVLRKDLHSEVLQDLNEVVKTSGLSDPCITEAQLPIFPDLVLEFASVDPKYAIKLRIPPSRYFQRRPNHGDCRGLFIQSTGTLNNGLGHVPDHILGQPLMEEYYTLFDKQNKRVGFAPMKGC